MKSKYDIKIISKKTLSLIVERYEYNSLNGEIKYRKSVSRNTKKGEIAVKRAKIDLIINHFKHAISVKLHVDNQEILEMLQELLGKEG